MICINRKHGQKHWFGNIKNRTVQSTHLKIVSLGDSKSSQVSRTFLSNLTDLNNSILWIVSTSPQISRSIQVPLLILWVLFQVCQLQLISPSLSCSIVVCFLFFSVAWQSLDAYLSFCFLLLILCGLPERQSSQFGRFSFFFLRWLSLRLIVWPRLDDPFVSQNPREFCPSHSPGRILACANIICSYGLI